MDSFDYLLRLGAFSVFGLILGLQALMLVVLWQTRRVTTRRELIMRALYFTAQSAVYSSYLLVLHERLQVRAPINYWAAGIYYAGAILTIILFLLGIHTERAKWRYARSPGTPSGTIHQFIPKEEE